jgi:pantothenate kinase type III
VHVPHDEAKTARSSNTRIKSQQGEAGEKIRTYWQTAQPRRKTHKELQDSMSAWLTKNRTKHSIRTAAY